MRSGRTGILSGGDGGDRAVVSQLRRQKNALISTQRRKSPGLGAGTQKKFNWRLVAPTFLKKQPFGQQVEGLSHFKDKTYAIELEVQTDHFEQSTLRRRIRRNHFSDNF